MARTIHRLTALAVERAKEPALYPDGAGLYLKVSKAKTRSWVYRYGHNGKTRYAGLGPFPTVSLAAAREARRRDHDRRRAERVDVDLECEA
jgi:hypothetical protein